MDRLNPSERQLAPVIREDELAELHEARERIDHAIALLESDDDEETATSISPCPECGATFGTLTATLDHARDEHGIDV